MHAQTVSLLEHDHNFAIINPKGERKTRQVLVLSALTMVIEIVAGFKLGSMALYADGWHMGTHVAAFLITLIAYRYARRHRKDHAFAFGTGKVGVLGAFASAIALAIAAFIMLVESGHRFFSPHPIRFDEAIVIAVIGLSVNLLSALLLKDYHVTDSSKHNDHSTHDHNLKAAYLHVLADGLTSILAIVALYLGKFYGLIGLDPFMGFLGAIIILRWSYGLTKETCRFLLDESIDLKGRQVLIREIESDSDNRVADLHVWQVAPQHYALIVSIVTHDPKEPDYYKNLLKNCRELGDRYRLSHITVEVTRCNGDGCV